MHPVRKQRLQIIIFMLIAIALATGFITFALRENINLFYPPADIAAGKVAAGKKIRAGGMVVPDSIIRESDSLKMSFEVTDYEATIRIHYEGILPDLFAEGEGIVATGILHEDGEFYASEVLAKHDENYMPPEVGDALKNSGYSADGEKKASKLKASGLSNDS